MVEESTGEGGLRRISAELMQGCASAGVQKSSREWSLIADHATLRAATC